MDRIFKKKRKENGLKTNAICVYSGAESVCHGSREQATLVIGSSATTRGAVVAGGATYDVIGGRSHR